VNPHYLHPDLAIDNAPRWCLFLLNSALYSIFRYDTENDN
jgi:hypothetical protein